MHLQEPKYSPVSAVEVVPVRGPVGRRSVQGAGEAYRFVIISTRLGRAGAHDVYAKRCRVQPCLPVLTCCWSGCDSLIGSLRKARAVRVGHDDNEQTYSGPDSARDGSRSLPILMLSPNPQL
jgi:hypothetical protein